MGICVGTPWRLKETTWTWAHGETSSCETIKMQGLKFSEDFSCLDDVFLQATRMHLCEFMFYTNKSSKVNLFVFSAVVVQFS